MESNKIKTIIFDVDGTLLDSLLVSTKTLQQALKEVTGKEYTYDELYFHFGITLEDALAKLEISNEDAAKIAPKLDYYYSQAKKELFPHIREVLEELTKNNINLGIVTSKTKEEYHNDFEPLDIEKYFKLVICSEDTLKHKPYSDPLNKFFEISKLDKETSIYIGDTNYDMMCAHSANMKFGLASWGAKNKKVEAEYYLNNPTDLLNIIK
jgi:HAD superfamily hydrolase (TIGR01549 family)